MLHNTVKKSNSVQGETGRKYTVKLLSIMREIKQHFGTFKFFSSPPLLISKVPKTVRSLEHGACKQATFKVLYGKGKQILSHIFFLFHL